MDRKGFGFLSVLAAPIVVAVIVGILLWKFL